MLKIGDFSRLSRISVRMLRHYDEIGLLPPVHIDPDTLYRYYDERQLITAARIAALRDMGFSLSEIGELLPGYGDRSTILRCLHDKQEALRALMRQTEARLRLLDCAMARLRKDDPSMTYDVTLKTFPPRCAATVRRRIPTYDQEGQLWSLLMEETDALPLVPDNPCYCCAVFHDTEFREHDVDVEVQKTVRGTYADTAHVAFRTLPEVTAACALCRGSYAQMDGVTQAVAAWAADNGFALDGPMFFIYHVSPHETDNPDEYVTEVCLPVRKA